MQNFLFLVIGALLMYLILQKPLQIKVHHIHEDVNATKNTKEMRALEEEMFKEDPKADANYSTLEANFSEVIQNVSDIMGGSDR